MAEHTAEHNGAIPNPSQGPASTCRTYQTPCSADLILGSATSIIIPHCPHITSTLLVGIPLIWHLQMHTAWWEIHIMGMIRRSITSIVPSLRHHLHPRTTRSLSCPISPLECIDSNQVSNDIVDWALCCITADILLSSTHPSISSQQWTGF